MSAMMDDAQWNLVTNFRSVTVLTALDEATGRLLPSLDDVGRWLQAFTEAFLEANQHVNGGRLHAFSGRRLVLTGDHLLPEFESVGRLCEVARQCGVAVLLSASLDALARHALALASLRSVHPALLMQIDCSGFDAGLAPTEREAYADVLRCLAESGVELNLVGDIESLRAAGLMNGEAFNSKGFSISSPKSGVRPVHRLHHVSPCRDYIALYIDSHGDFYPCAGMVAHKASRLGSLSAPFGELLVALAHTRVSIDTLAPLGPRIASRFADQVERYPVDLCALHRRAVSSPAAL